MKHKIFECSQAAQKRFVIDLMTKAKIHKVIPSDLDAAIEIVMTMHTEEQFANWCAREDDKATEAAA